jgi:hypothetical protein
VASNGIKVMPNFVKIGLLDQHLEGVDARRELSHLLFLTQETKIKKKCIRPTHLCTITAFDFRSEHGQ